jgi:hypothetical protein
MANIQVIFYKECRLTVIKQPAGGYQVDIVRIAGAKPVLTKTFRELSDAVDEAR